MNKPLPRLDIEKLFDRIVMLAGGRRVDELVGKSPPFDNADYYFESDVALAELKIIEKDDAADNDLQKKIQNLVAKWVSEARIPPLPAGRVRLSSADLPEDLQLEFIRQFRSPLKGRVAKAGDQLKQTKAAFQLPHAHGLLLLVNDGNPMLKPSVALNLLHHLLRTDHSAIHHVVFCSVNLPITIAHANRSGPLWTSASVEGRPAFPAELLERLSVCWRTALNDFYGINFPTLNMTGSDEKQFEEIVFDEGIEHRREGLFLQPKRFYESRKLGFKYFCDNVSEGTAHLYLVESCQSGKLIQAVFDQKVVWSDDYIQIEDKQEIQRLMKMLKKMKRG